MSEESNGGKVTLGEELFLVHLSRSGDPTTEDFDHDEEILHHVPVMTVGEELWRIHLKRNASVRDAEDVDDDNDQDDCRGDTGKSTDPANKKVREESSDMEDPSESHRQAIISTANEDDDGVDWTFILTGSEPNLTEIDR